MTTALSARQVALVKKTIASDCDHDEFDLFMAAAKQYGLDPFRKQIIPLVFNKNNPAKRRMSIVVTRDGSRVIAQRCGNYRPASDPVEYEQSDELKSPTNPAGIVLARVYLWQRDSGGEWFKVVGEAYWDEFVPLKPVWQNGRPTDQQQLDGNWKTMPKLMISKCAEQQALRAGWPDQFSALYAEEEMDKAVAEDFTASEIVAMNEEAIRKERIHAGESILLQFNASGIDRVPIGQVADRVLDHIAHLAPEDVKTFSVRNREPLKDFWAREPADALALKKAIEKAGEEA